MTNDHKKVRELSETNIVIIRETLHLSTRITKCLLKTKSTFTLKWVCQIFIVLRVDLN